MPKEPNHHYIPEFYLQEWADPQTRRLVEFCRRYKDKVVARPTAPAGTGYQPGLYKDPDAQEGEEYVIETKLMSSIDNWASKALQLFKTMGSLPGKLESEEALGWCRFLYSLIVRNPDHLEVIREKLRTLDPAEILEYIRDDYPRIRRPEDPETLRHAAAALSSLSAPRMTILSASSGNGRCKAFASSHGALIQTSRSSSVVRITGIALS